MKVKELVGIPLEYCRPIFSLSILEMTATDTRWNTRLAILSPVQISLSQCTQKQ